MPHKTTIIIPNHISSNYLALPSEEAYHSTSCIVSVMVVKFLAPINYLTGKSFLVNYLNLHNQISYHKFLGCHYSNE